MNVFPYWLTSVAALCLGAAFVSEGAGRAAKLTQIREGARQRRLLGGLSTEVLGGVAGIILAIISLAGVAGGVLIPISVMVFGGTLMLGTSAWYETDEQEAETRSRTAELAHEAAKMSNGARIFVGVGVLTLGILSTIGIVPGLLLPAVGLLCAGAVLFLGGSTVGARVALTSAQET